MKLTPFGQKILKYVSIAIYSGVIIFFALAFGNDYLGTKDSVKSIKQEISVIKVELSATPEPTAIATPTAKLLPIKKPVYQSVLKPTVVPTVK